MRLSILLIVCLLTGSLKAADPVRLDDLGRLRTVSQLTLDPSGGRAVAVVDGCGGGEASGVCLSRFSSALGWGWSSASRAAGEPGQSSLTSAKEKAQSCSLCLLEEILCILRSYPTSAESDQLGLLCCQPEPFADASTPLNGSFSVFTHWGLSARSGALICMHQITWQVRLQFRAKVVTGRIPGFLYAARKALSAPARA